MKASWWYVFRGLGGHVEEAEEGETNKQTVRSHGQRGLLEYAHEVF